eukprot:gene19631-25542_t
MDVRGNTTQIHNSNNSVHPVIKELYNRAISGKKRDGNKIALAIEGGGMRGCVAAGMATAVWYLGLQDSIDIVYGSSAGSLVGAYFIADQMPYYGPEALFHCCGLRLLDFRLDSLKNFINERIGKPVINLNYLLNYIVKDIKPIDWNIFWNKQLSKDQVLKVVASGLVSKKSIALSVENNNFDSYLQLSNCMRASMLLPGITGDAVRFTDSQISSSTNLEETLWPEYITRFQSKLTSGSEPFSDVLRTRPDGVTVTSKMGLIEKLIIKRYFGRKLKLPSIVNWMLNQYHKLVYAEDILLLNQANNYITTSGNETLYQQFDLSYIHTIALPEDVQEVKRMETNASILLENVRLGFAAAYKSLQIDNNLKNDGYNIAMRIWPDSTLNDNITLIKPEPINLRNSTIL